MGSEIKIDHTFRNKLPASMAKREELNVWSMVKRSCGKELSSVTMPVIFNEPLSFLQRMVEYMEYSNLLVKAAQETDPLIRMQYMSAFAVSALSSNWERPGKPFNPLLGETYELQRDGFKVVCEQVSHHPPVSAFHAESEHFIFYGSIYPKLKFWGKSVEIQPKGTVTVELTRWGEAYTWSNVNCCVHNLIVGKLWIEQYGTMEIRNHKTGHTSTLTFKPSTGGASKDIHRVEGFIQDKDNVKQTFIYGKWTEFIRCTDYSSFEDYAKENPNKFRSSDSKYNSVGSESPAQTPKKVLAKLNSLKMGQSLFKSMSISTNEPDDEDSSDGPEDVPKSDSTFSIDIPNSVTLWEANPRPERTSEFYQFTAFTMSLNEIEPSMEGKLCPTDSRLRPDIRKLEKGDLDGAAAEKHRLEEKQREAKKTRKSKKGQEWTPKWFEKQMNKYTNQEDWMFNGKYWERDFTDIDIF
nr:PREDICTED: oxysterol-binding protein-related protein 2 [Bemisia tabaci]